MGQKQVPLAASESDDPRVLRADIDRTRQDITDTLDTLRERLSPGYLKDQAVNAMKKRSKETGGRIRDSIRENPWPVMLTGAGLSWMVGSMARGAMQRRAAKREHVDRLTADEIAEAYEPDYDYGLSEVEAYEAEGEVRGVEEGGGRAEQIREQGRHMADQGREAAHRVREQARDLGHRASEFGHQVGEQASHVTEKVRDQSRRAVDTAESTFQSHPLTTGLATLAAGLATGLLIPATRKERQWMGQTSRGVMEDAKEYGRDIAERGKHVAERTFEAAQSEATESSKAEAQKLRESGPGA